LAGILLSAGVHRGEKGKRKKSYAKYVYLHLTAIGRRLVPRQVGLTWSIADAVTEFGYQRDVSMAAKQAAENNEKQGFFAHE
jgi:hypothetical protein